MSDRERPDERDREYGGRVHRDREYGGREYRGREYGAHDEPEPEYTEPAREAGLAPESLWLRLVWMVLIAIMLQVAQTVLAVATVLQFILMLFNGRQPNERLAEFGTSLGIWIAKATRFQIAASETRPWPWTDLD